MENMVLFAGSVVIYLLLIGYLVFFGGAYKPELKKLLKITAILALLCLPVNINGHVFTVMGMAKSEKNVFSGISVYQEGENVYSLFAIMQVARNDAFAVFSPFAIQKAGNDAVTIFGISGYQRAGHDAITWVGISGYQVAGKEKTAKRTFGMFGALKAPK